MRIWPVVLTTALIAGTLVAGCAKRSVGFFPNDAGGEADPTALLSEWCTSMAACDAPRALALMRWSTKSEADMHQVLFLDKDQFFRVVPTLRDDIDDLDASYAVFKTFERGLQKLAQDVGLAMGRGETVRLIDETTSAFDAYPEVLDDASHAKRRPLQLRRVHERWYLWDISCFNYTHTSDK